MKKLLRETVRYRWYKQLRAKFANLYYHHPSRDLTIIGVTGTDGKTTTCSLIHFLLQSLAGKTVFIGTTGARIGDEPVAGVQKMTSYDPMALQSVLSKAHLSGAVYGVLEVSSHGLDQHRFDGVSFSVGVLTNISKEHLDYHGTFDNYVRSKQRLFYQVQGSENETRAAILPYDDQVGRNWSKRMSFKETVMYGLSDTSPFRAEQIEVGPEGSKFELVYQSNRRSVTLPLEGFFNVRNALAALAAVSVMGVPIDQAVEQLQHFPGLPGRQERYEIDGVTRYIDFAHTPQALEAVLQYLKSVSTEGRVICVFGAPGMRDKGKRADMGSTVQQYADVMIITDDDADRESRWSIIGDITKGVTQSLGDDYYILPERRDAIQLAIDIAKPGDTVLLAGKGHEKVIVTNYGKMPWSDVDVLHELTGQEN